MITSEVNVIKMLKAEYKSVTGKEYIPGQPPVLEECICKGSVNVAKLIQSMDTHVYNKYFQVFKCKFS